jgi:hypothetical protein
MSNTSIFQSDDGYVCKRCNERSVCGRFWNMLFGGPHNTVINLQSMYVEDNQLFQTIMTDTSCASCHEDFYEECRSAIRENLLVCLDQSIGNDVCTVAQMVRQYKPFYPEIMEPGEAGTKDFQIDRVRLHYDQNMNYVSHEYIYVFER